jgi:hypothetical protein
MPCRGSAASSASISFRIHPVASRLQSAAAGCTPSAGPIQEKQTHFDAIHLEGYAFACVCRYSQTLLSIKAVARPRTAVQFLRAMSSWTWKHVRMRSSSSIPKLILYTTGAVFELTGTIECRGLPQRRTLEGLCPLDVTSDACSLFRALHRSRLPEVSHLFDQIGFVPLFAA